MTDYDNEPTPPQHLDREAQEQWLNKFFNIDADNRWMRIQLDQRELLSKAIEKRTEGMPDIPL